MELVLMLSALLLFPFCLAYYTSFRLRSFVFRHARNRFLQNIYLGSIFVVSFRVFLAILTLIMGLSLGPLGGLIEYLVGSAVVQFMDPQVLLLLVYFLGIGLVNFSVGREVVPQPPSQPTPRLVLAAIALVALVVIVSTAWKPALSSVAELGGPSLLSNPYLCEFLNTRNDTYVAHSERIVKCVRGALPEGASIYDYCDALPTASQLTFNQKKCHVERVVALSDPRACAELRDTSAGTSGYHDCLAQFPGSPEHVVLCASLIERANFASAVDTKCITSANINVPDKNGRTAVFYSWTVDDLRDLIALGARLDVRDPSGETPLLDFLVHRVGSGGGDPAEHYRMIELYLKSGSNPNVSDIEGFTPLTSAIRLFSTVDIVKLLIAQGADIHYRNAKSESVCDVAESPHYPSPRRDYILSLCN